MTKKKVWQTDRVPLELYPTVEQLTNFLNGKYSPETQVLLDPMWDDEYDYSESYLAVRYEREETDKEYAYRLKREAREKERQERIRAKQEAEELAMLKRLKKKYPNG